MCVEVGEVSTTGRRRVSWTIPWFRVPVSDICIRSPEFRCAGSSSWKFSMSKTRGKRSVSITLRNLNPGDRPLRVQLDVTARGDNNSETALLNNTEPTYITTHHEQRFRFVYADQIVVMGEIIRTSFTKCLKTYARAEKEKDRSDKKMATPKSAAKLRGDMKNLLLSGKDRDVVLKVEDKDFKAHRSILGIRSPVFSTMFEHDTLEMNSRVVDINDCNSDTFPAFLHYIYTGSVEDLTWERVMSLYQIADKFQVPELKEDCLEIMEAKLTAENFCDVLSFSLGCEEPDLEEATALFFLWKAADIVRTPKWEVFLRENLESANALYLQMAIDGRSTRRKYSGKNVIRRICMEAGRDIVTPKSAAKLRGDLKNLLLRSNHRDVILSVEDKDFKAHRNILGLRSPVFSAMFEHDTIKRNSRVLDIKDCKSDTFSAFLHYIYTGNVEDVTMEMVMSLYRIADKYQVPELTEDCLGRMEANLTAKNFCDVLSFSLDCQESNLKEAATEFFLSKAAKIVKTAKWQVFLWNNPAAANELYLKLAIVGPPKRSVIKARLHVNRSMEEECVIM